jgi:hypothetical protein
VSNVQENGVFKGYVLSVTLFAIAINSVVRAISPHVSTSLYVDDVAICYASKSMDTKELLQHGHTIVFCWIPGHTGIPGIGCRLCYSDWCLKYDRNMRPWHSCLPFASCLLLVARGMGGGCQQ